MPKKDEKVQLKTITYMLDLEYPADSVTVPSKLEYLIEQMEKTFFMQYPSSLINLKVDKVDLDQKLEKGEALGI